MALNTLTLAVVQGVQGRRFRSKINGLTAGTEVSVDVDATPGFGVVNGRLSHHALPYAVNTVAIRERVPATGETKVTRIEIAAASASDLAAQAAALIGVGRTLRSQRTAATDDGAGSLTWAIYVEDDLGSTATSAVGSGVLAAFKAARNATKNGTSHTIIACNGSSIFTGAGGNPSGSGNTNAFEGNWEKYLADDFIAAGYNVTRDSVWGISGLNSPSAAAAYAAYNTRAVIGAGWIAGGQNSVGGPYWRNSTNADTFVFTPALNCNKIDLYFPGGNGVTGTISYSIDGGAAVNVVQSGSARIIKVSVDVTLGPHTVTITRVSGLCAFIGIDCYNTMIGQIRIWNMGWASTTTAAYADNSTAFAAPSMLTYLAADIDLQVMALGINDWSTALTAQYGIDLAVVGNAATSAGASQIVIGDHNINAGGANRTAYNAVAEAYAASRGVSYIDQGLNFGSYAEASARGDMDDGVHPSTQGYRRYANPISVLALAA